MSSATALIASSAEASREFREEGSDIFSMAIGESARFATCIGDGEESALMEALRPYAKVGTRGYTCFLFPEKTFTHRIRLVRHVQAVHVASGIGKPATSKTLQMANALYNRDHVLVGVGIATGTCAPAGRYLSRSAALISGWVRECRPKARSADGREI